MTAQDDPRRSRKIPLLLVAVVGVIAVVVTWLQMSNPFGDAGMSNASSFVLCGLGGGLVFLWLTLASGLPRRVRFSILGGGVALIAFGSLLFRVEGFSGAMIPTFRSRFGGSEREHAEARAPESGIDLATRTPHDFPGFLGPRRDGTIEGVTLAADWEAQPPTEMWRREVGAGWSGFAVVNGYAVTMEQWEDDEVVSAYRVKDGELMWSHASPGKFAHFLGGDGPRATPTVHGGRVYTLGAFGRLACLDGARGELLWEHDLLDEYGLTPSMEQKLVQYGRSNSPLAFDSSIVVPAGGDPDGRMAGLVAYDAVSGELLWESPPRQVSFASPTRATIAGIDQILIVNEASVTGHAPDTGRLLWERPWPGTTAANASVSQPAPLPPNRVLVSKGYGGGAALFSLEAGDDGALEVSEVWANRRAMRTKFTNAVFREGHAYALSDGILECVDLATGERVWRRGRYGHGQVLLVGAHLIVVTEEGEVVLVGATPTEPDSELGRFQAVEGKTWNNPALYGNVLLVRNAREATAWRLPLVER